MHRRCSPGRDLRRRSQVSEEDTQKSRAPGQRWREMVSDRAHVGLATIIGAGATVLASIVAVVALFLPGDPPNPPPSTPQAPSASEASSGGRNAPDERATAESGCFVDDRPVACDVDHNAETFQGAECTHEALVRHLGGRPGLDILRPDLSVVRTDAGGCAVRFPFVTAQHAEGALARDGGHAWRWCRAAASGADVPCSDPHDQEVVARERVGAGSDFSCEEFAGEYMSVSWEHVRSVLEVVEELNGDGRICVVSPRGDDSLEGSLRDLGAAALPLGRAL